MFRDYVESTLNKRKYEADTGSTGGSDSSTDNANDVDGQNDAGDAADESDSNTSNESDSSEKKEKLFTRAELASIVKAETQKAIKEHQTEAEKLANMSAEEKAEAEKQKLLDRIAEYERKENFNSLSKEASKTLSEQGIAADDEILSLLVKDTAENTSESVKSFVKLIEREREAIRADFEKRLGSRIPLDSTSKNESGEGAFGKELAERTKGSTQKSHYFKN